MVISRLVTINVSNILNVLTASSNLARGWGDSIDWKSYYDAADIAKETSKPVMIIVHKPTCPTCKSLKQQFSRHQGALELSKHFVMVNLEPPEVPNLDLFYPDGSYVPRIMFFDKDFNLLKEVISKEDYKYFYRTADAIVASMQRVAKMS